MTVTTGARSDLFAADPSLGSSRAFEALFMCATVAIVAIDRDGRVLMWNRGAERVLGWSREEVVGRTLPVVAPEDRERFASVRARVMDGQEIDGMVMSHVRSDGSRVDLELSLRALSDGAGEPRAILGVASEPSGRSRDGELADRIERLEGRLAASRLPPHFLFNSLHAIHVLLRRGDSGQAASMLEHLSDILRHAVRSDVGGETSLEEEIDFLERYLEVQQARFGSRFTFRVDIEEGLARARVPSMLLQPLVENALRHGFEMRREGTVTVTARGRESRARLRVRDDGAGLPSSWSLEEDCGVGLRATRARLRRLYGDGFSFAIRNHPDGGAEACVEIPWRRVSGAEG